MDHPIRAWAGRSILPDFDLEFSAGPVFVRVTNESDTHIFRFSRNDPDPDDLRPLMEGQAISHPRLVRFVLDVAEQENIPHHTTTIKGGGTDANRFQISGQGTPSLAICVPSRYIHSHSSVVDLRDYEATLKLLVALVRRLDAATVAAIRG